MTFKIQSNNSINGEFCQVRLCKHHKDLTSLNGTLYHETPDTCGHVRYDGTRCTESGETYSIQANLVPCEDNVIQNTVDVFNLYLRTVRMSKLQFENFHKFNFNVLLTTCQNVFHGSHNQFVRVQRPINELRVAFEVEAEYFYEKLESYTCDSDFDNEVDFSNYLQHIDPLLLENRLKDKMTDNCYMKYVTYVCLIYNLLYVTTNIELENVTPRSISTSSRIMTLFNSFFKDVTFHEDLVKLHPVSEEMFYSNYMYKIVHNIVSHYEKQSVLNAAKKVSQYAD